MTAPKISVIIATFRRPDGLLQAVKSVAAQTYDLSAIELIVCDNAPEGDAKSAIEAFAASVAFPVIYLHAKEPGVANARNLALSAAKGEFIAFLDDDEEAMPQWLVELLRVQAAFECDVVFGPVKARLLADAKHYKPYFEAFFSRFGPDTDQVLSSYYGCGNSLIKRDVLPKTYEIFSVSRNAIGGEDDVLFQSLYDQKCSFGWAANAVVFEDVPPSRSRLSYTLRRAFAFGQGPAHTAAHTGRYFQMLFWMVQGLIQALVFTALGALCYLVACDQAASLFDKAARGMGKCLWFPPFKFSFYGTALLKKTDSQ